MSLSDHKAAIFYRLVQGTQRWDEDKVKIYTHMVPITPAAEYAFSKAESHLVDTVKNVRRRYPHADVPDYDPVLCLLREPLDTLEERAQKYFSFWLGPLFELYESFYEHERVVHEKIAGINKKAARASTLALWSLRLKETPEDRKRFARLMEETMRRLPDMEGAHFGVLTPEQAYDNDCNGLYEPPPADRVCVPLSNYPMGAIRPVSEWKKILAHEASHRQRRNEKDHDIEFRLREDGNLRILNSSSTAETAETVARPPQQPVRRPPAARAAQKPRRKWWQL